jgi:ketose-bisphosphate aldolase
MNVSSKELFRVARKKNFAYPAFNYIDQLSADAIVREAEKLNVPVFLCFAEVLKEFIEPADAFEIGRYYAEKAKVPVVLHLDHGTTKSLIFDAIDSGFKSVMIDASSDPFEENVRRTREVVEYAHLRGAVVEAEIGHVGTGSDYNAAGDAGHVYTTVEEAKKFVEATDVDSLAISIGTAHGAYKGTPHIDFERLSEIRAAIDTPLVLHGGSSSGDENLKRCATGGISKINIYTDLFASAYEKAMASKPKDYHELRDVQREGLTECLDRYFHVFETVRYAEGKA